MSCKTHFVVQEHETVQTFFSPFLFVKQKANLIALENSNTAGQTRFELHLQEKGF